MNSIKNPLSDKRYCDPLSSRVEKRMDEKILRSLINSEIPKQQTTKVLCYYGVLYLSSPSIFKPSLGIITLSGMVFDDKEKVIEKLQTTLVLK